MHRTGIKRARSLRQNMTDAERKLWLALRDRRVGGLKFRRQVPIGRWTVDFLCIEEMLIVEVDGGQHGGTRDALRDAALADRGYRVLRFWNIDVLNNMDGVIDTIQTAITGRESG